MTKHEYLRELRARIAHLPREDQEAALTYYEEYFQEVGEDGVQQAIRDLGSPREVAERIIEDCAQRGSTGYHRVRREGEADYAGPSYGESYRSAGDYRPKRQPSGCLVAFLVCTSIIWVPVLLGIGLAAIGLLFGLLIVLGVLVFVAVVLAEVAVKMIFANLAGGLLTLGYALSSAGLFLLLMVPTVLFFTRFLPFALRGFRRRREDYGWQQDSPGPDPVDASWQPREEPYVSPFAQCFEEENYKAAPEPDSGRQPRQTAEEPQPNLTREPENAPAEEPQPAQESAPAQEAAPAEEMEQPSGIQLTLDPGPVELLAPEEDPQQPQDGGERKDG